MRHKVGSTVELYEVPPSLRGQQGRVVGTQGRNIVVQISQKGYALQLTLRPDQVRSAARASGGSRCEGRPGHPGRCADDRHRRR